MPTLQEELDALLASVMQQVPGSVFEISDAEIAKIAANQMPSGLQVGDVAPEFILNDALGNAVSLYRLLQSGPVVLSFYRGAWCPYCNLELRALQQGMPLFRQRNASLVAISPQTPDHSLSLVEKHSLEFPVLSDPTGKTLQDYKLLYEFTPELRKLYESAFQINVAHYNGNLGWKLPVSATYVIDQSGKIRAAAANIDYTKRMNIEDIVAALSSIE